MLSPLRKRFPGEKTAKTIKRRRKMKKTFSDLSRMNDARRLFRGFVDAMVPFTLSPLVYPRASR
jgi:hypothetical protein